MPTRLNCARKQCNELLRCDTGLQILIAAYNDVMSAAYCGFANKKQKTSTRTLLQTGCNKRTNNNAERDEWERYFGVANSAARAKSKRSVGDGLVPEKRWLIPATRTLLLPQASNLAPALANPDHSAVLERI